MIGMCHCSPGFVCETCAPRPCNHEACARAKNERQSVSSPIEKAEKPAMATDSSESCDPLDPATDSPFDSALSWAFHDPLAMD